MLGRGAQPGSGAVNNRERGPAAASATATGRSALARSTASLGLGSPASLLVGSARPPVPLVVAARPGRTRTCDCRFRRLVPAAGRWDIGACGDLQREPHDEIFVHRFACRRRIAHREQSGGCVAGGAAKTKAVNPAHIALGGTAGPLPRYRRRSLVSRNGSPKSRRPQIASRGSSRS